MLGFKIREYRLKNGLSQKALAKTLGVSTRSIVRWEHDSAKPGPEEMNKLKKIIGITDEDILSMKEEDKTDGQFGKADVLNQISDGVDNLVTGQESISELLSLSREDYRDGQAELIKRLQAQNDTLLSKLDAQSSVIESYKMELEQSKLQSRHGRIRTTVIVITCLIVILFTVGTWLYIMNYGFKGEINEGSASIETVYYYHIDDEQINQGG